MRIENLADRSDLSYVNVFRLFDAYWLAGNQVSGGRFDSVNIQEMSLTGNMLLNEMENRRIHWKTVDNVDGKFEMGVRKAAKDITHVQLMPMQMRLFEATFTPQKESASFLQ